MTTLLERAHELTALRGALTDAREGRGRLVLIDGAAGLGKTSLLRAAAEMAADADFTCHRARASELERDFAYGCVRQLFEPAVARSPDLERERVFDGAAAFAGPLLAAGERTPRAGSADNTFAVLHGLYWLLNNLAGDTPVVLCIDDLHWSDGESLRFLNYLAPRLDGLPVAVLATARTGSKVAPDLARLTAAPETTVLRLAPLSLEATVTLCERVLGAPVAHDFAAACRDATGGNPFYLEALLREAKDRRLSTGAREASHVHRLGPAAVARAVLLRLAGAPPGATAFVRAASVLGDGAGVTVAARLADLPDEEAAHGADLLCSLGILRPAQTVEFAHSIVRKRYMRRSARSNACGCMPAPPHCWPRPPPPTSGSRRRWPRRSRPAIRDGSSCCDAWPRRHSRMARRPPQWRGSSAHSPSRRRPRLTRRCCSSSAPANCVSPGRRPSPISPPRSTRSGNRRCSHAR